MTRVSVIGTVHVEKGLANVPALCAILERLRPEVIFLEMPPAAYVDYIEAGTHANLESIAVRQYRENHRLETVPVDLPTPENEFFRFHKRLHGRIAVRSGEYHRLLDRHGQYVSVYGFAFLNSDHCSALWSELYAEMRKAVGAIGDDGLVELFESWNRTIDRRDKEMVKNIADYCRQNTFKRGVFLVGAAHRQSIFDKSREQSESDSFAIEWDFPELLGGTS